MKLIWLKIKKKKKGKKKKKTLYLLTQPVRIFCRILPSCGNNPSVFQVIDIMSPITRTRQPTMHLFRYVIILATK